LTLHKAPSYLVLNNLFPFITTKSLSLFIFLILSGWIQHHIWTNTFFENKPFIQGFYGNMNSIEVPYVLWMNSELLTILELEPDDYRNGLQALNKCNEVILQFRTWRSKLIDKGASFGINSNIAKLEGCDLLLRKSYYERLKSIIPNLVFYTYIMKN
ncbi:hypothetical protein, partial [Pasteurella multocida]|uniref:hypothetical protein n=1 Tax=Pasteurella multocida TaxID=747 RepID=UPI002301EBA5